MRRDRQWTAIRVSGNLAAVFTFLFTVAVFRASGADEAEQPPAEQSAALLARGDTAAALDVLDRALKLDKKDGAARLARAGLYFTRGDGKAALRDYREATGLEDRSLRVQAWLGLSRTHRTLFRDRYQAELACRKGLSLSPDNPDLMLEKALVQFAYGGADGYSQGMAALVKLICLDPAYPGVYRMWRDSVPNPDLGQFRQVRQCLEPWLAAHPDSVGWWMDLAWDCFLEGASDSALAMLERLGRACPDYNSPDRELLVARCKIENGDSAAFMEHYSNALDLAVKLDQDTRAFLETEVILTRAAAPRWGECKTNRDKAAFLRWYWLDLDDDPLEILNRRLIEHYNRLNYAQRNFLVRFPHSYFNTSEDYNRLLTAQSMLYYYDSEPLRRQTAILGLDPRGVVWVRLGPPEKRETHYNEGKISDLNIAQSPPKFVPFGKNEGNVVKKGNQIIVEDEHRKFKYRESDVLGYNHEYWYYDKATMLFVDYGEYTFVPQQEEGKYLDMLKVLGRERFIDPKVNYTLEYYMAQFLAGNSLDNEIEFYQDDWLPKGETPTADLAVYDSLWGLMGRTGGQVFKVREEKDRALWLARHRITVFPGEYHYTIRMASGDEKWLGKGDLEFAPFEPDSLNLSAVVLGTPPAEGLESPERMGERFIPRPTTRFGRDEEMKVYFEVYNLRPDSAGERNYREWIDVVRLEDGETKIKKYAGKVFQLLVFNFSDPRTSLTHIFDRRADWRGDRAPESFSLDVSGLESGAYRIVIQVRDNVSGQWDIEETFFDIQGSGEAALK